MTGPRKVRPRSPEMLAWDVTADNVAEVATWCGGRIEDWNRGSDCIAIPGPECQGNGTVPQRAHTYAFPQMSVVVKSADLDYHYALLRADYDALYQDEVPA